jgi:prevent-host-death family protein
MARDTLESAVESLDEDLQVSHTFLMRAVTIREAKARLNELVEAATRGEQVVLMRGSKHVAALVAVSADELELPARLSDPQAERLWRQLGAERRDGSSLVFKGPAEAVAYLSGRQATRARRRRQPGATATRRRRRP